MKPFSWDKQLGLASPLKCAAIQSGQTNNPSRNETGLDVSHHIHVSPEGRGKNFFLDILFHRMSDIGIFQQLSEFHCSKLTIFLLSDCRIINSHEGQEAYSQTDTRHTLSELVSGAGGEVRTQHGTAPNRRFMQTDTGVRRGRLSWPWTAQDATQQVSLARGRHTTVLQEASSCPHHMEWRL